MDHKRHFYLTNGETIYVDDGRFETWRFRRKGGWKCSALNQHQHPLTVFPAQRIGRRANGAKGRTSRTRLGGRKMVRPVRPDVTCHRRPPVTNGMKVAALAGKSSPAPFAQAPVSGPRRRAAPSASSDSSRLKRPCQAPPKPPAGSVRTTAAGIKPSSRKSKSTLGHSYNRVSPNHQHRSNSAGVIPFGSTAIAMALSYRESVSRTPPCRVGVRRLVTPAIMACARHFLSYVNTRPGPCFFLSFRPTRGLAAHAQFPGRKTAPGLGALWKAALRRANTWFNNLSRLMPKPMLAGTAACVRRPKPTLDGGCAPS